MPSKRGTNRPPATPASEGFASTASNANASTITPPSTVITASKPRTPPPRKDKNHKHASAVKTPQPNKGNARATRGGAASGDESPVECGIKGKHVGIPLGLARAIYVESER